MFYRITNVLIAKTSMKVQVDLIEKTKFFTEVVRSLHFDIPIEDGRTVFKDEVNPMVEAALRESGITVEGPEFASSVTPVNLAAEGAPTSASLKEG